MARKQTCSDFQMNDLRREVAKFISTARSKEYTGWEFISYGVSILNNHGKVDYELAVYDGNIKDVYLIVRVISFNPKKMTFDPMPKFTRIPISQTMLAQGKNPPNNIWMFLQFAQTYITKRLKKAMPGQASIHCRICVGHDYEMVVDHGGTAYFERGYEIDWEE